MWIVAPLALCFAGGCGALHPLQGLPAHHLSDELRLPRRSGQTTVDLSLLRQTPPLEHCVDGGDVLGIYIEGVLGRDGDIPPIHVPTSRFVPPSVGYPIAVQEDGTISLPLLRRLYVRGMTIRQVEDTIRQEYTRGERALLQPGQDRILVSLQQPRQYSVIVVRQEADNAQGNLGASETVNFELDKRGTGRIVRLRAYENDVLHALAETGGLPGLDAENAVYIIRGRRGGCPPPARTSVAQPVVRGQSPHMPSHANMETMRTAPVPQTFPLPQTAWLNGGGMQTPTIPGRSYRTWDALQSHPEPMGSPSPVWHAPSPVRAVSSSPAHGFIAPSSPASGLLLPSPDISGSGHSGDHAAPMDDLMNSPHSSVAPPMGVPWNEFSINDPAVIRIPLRVSPGEAPSFSEQDIILQDGDILFVESRETEFFYTGGLLGGGQYTLPRDYDINVIDAISIAEARGRDDRGNSVSIGGVSVINQDVTVGASKVVVLRKRPDGSRLPIEVDLHRALRDPSYQILIQPEDRVILRYTPLESVAAFFERHFLEGFLIGAASSTLYGD